MHGWGRDGSRVPTRHSNTKAGQKVNNMNMGSEKYRKTLRRWNTLSWLDEPTERQRAEKARLEAELTAAEMADSPFALIADDYEFATGQAGNLGGTEIL